MTVRYDAVNAMLLNGFLKAHRQLLEQQTTNAQLQATMAELAAKVDELMRASQKTNTPR